MLSFTKIKGNYHSIESVSASETEGRGDAFIITAADRGIPAELVYQIPQHDSQPQIFIYIKHIPKINCEPLAVAGYLIFTTVRIVPKEAQRPFTVRPKAIWSK